MQIIFKTLTLQNFKFHRDLKVEFGDLTKISGENAKGKSTIPESIPWLVYGTDVFGSKMDPTPITYESDETLVTLLLSVDGKNRLLGRGLKKGKTQYYLNEVPSKAGEFNEVIDQLFEKDLFMSLYNPSYFPSLHWEKQRELILQYVTAPVSKEVLSQLPEEQGKTLGTHLKKHSLDDLEKIHKDSKNKKDKQYIADQSRTKTLQEQLDQLNKPNIDIDSVNAEIEQLSKQIEEADKLPAEAFKNNQKITRLQSEIGYLKDQRDQMKAQFQQIKNDPIAETCRACGQPLDEKSKKYVEDIKKQKITDFKKQYDQVVLKRKELEEQLSQLEYIDATEQSQKVRDLEHKRDQLIMQKQEFERYEQLSTQVKSSEANENGTLQALKASIFMLDSIKAFRAKEAELQAKKVQSLFETLSIRLFNEQKNGEIKPTFEIEMDGKPYSKLSLSESIRAGLELRDVLSQQSNIIAPCFVDNAESITKFKEPNGQLIISRVVAGQELKIEKDGEE